MKMDQKVSFITGGTKGIGAALAIELARRGSDVAINGRVADEQAQAVQSSIEALGRRCIIVAADVSDAAAAGRGVDSVVSLLGRLDVLVHSAGQVVRGSLLEASEETWYRTFDIHVHAVFHLCRAAVPFMRGQGEGAILLIGSAAGLRGYQGAIAYSVAKGALPQFARSLARELADYNIRVNCVSPGVTRTRLQEYLTAAQVKNNIDNRIPLHREGKAEDVAKLMGTLICNDLITGENVAIDGGMSMRMV